MELETGLSRRRLNGWIRQAQITAPLSDDAGQALPVVFARQAGSFLFDIEDVRGHLASELAGQEPSPGNYHILTLLFVFGVSRQEFFDGWCFHELRLRE
jgi:hypothetical protein